MDPDGLPQHEKLGEECPQNWSLITSPKRTCGRSTGIDCKSTTEPCTCDSAIFSNNGGTQYSEICGRVTGYRVSGTTGFDGYEHLHEDIDSAYVDGVSITHGNGSVRQHIWTPASTFSVLALLPKAN